MTDEQVADILGDLITAAKIRIPMLVTFAIVGVMLLVCGGCLCKKVQNINKDRTSYQALERLKVIDETTHQNGLPNLNKENNLNNTQS